MAGETQLLEVGAMFGAIAVAGAVARRANLSVIPFYIVVGMLSSQYVLGSLGMPHVENTEFVDLAAELGIVFLLFFLGIEFSMEQLLESRDRITKAGTVDLLINFPAGIVIGLALGWSVVEALLLGGIVYISSSAVITKSLIDLGWIANDEAGPMLGTLVYEDLFIAFYLALLSAILIGAGGLDEAVEDVALAIGFLLVLVGVVYYGTAFFQRLLEIDSAELTLLRTVAITVLVAGTALAIGVSEAVAAFFVGMGFSATDHVREIEKHLIPLRDVFAAVFFFWIGLITNPAVFADPAVVGLVLVAVLVTMPTKLVSGFLGGRIYGLTDRRSFRVGCGMVTRGEFSLIIATIAVSAAATPVMAEIIPAFAVGYVLVMSILGTVLMQYSEELWSLVGHRIPERGEPTPREAD